EALDRCREFLTDFGVATTRLRFHDGTPARRPLVAARGPAEDGVADLPRLRGATPPLRFHDGTPARRPLVAVRVSAEDGVDVLPRLIDQPDEPNESWMRGYLAGAFDSTGDNARHLSLCGDGVATALTRLGFEYVS